MATVKVRGAGHPGDPFQVLIALTDDDLDRARAPESIVLDVFEPPRGSVDGRLSRDCRVGCLILFSVEKLVNGDGFLAARA